MANEIIISNAAYDDLDDIFKYISDKLASPSAAGRLIDKIFGSIEKLRDFPLIGAVPSFSDLLIVQGYHTLIVDNFIVFYIPKDEEIHIIHVIYGKRDFEALLIDE